jgi:hypothetical protein
MKEIAAIMILFLKKNEKLPKVVGKRVWKQILVKIYS